MRQDKLFGHFVSDILGLSNAHTSMGAAFALRTFHVKPYEPSVAKICLHIFMTEAIKVGLRLYRSPNTTEVRKRKNACIFSFADRWV